MCRPGLPEFIQGEISWVWQRSPLSQYSRGRQERWTFEDWSVYSEFQASLGSQIPSENNNNTKTKQNDVWFWGPYSFGPNLLFC